MPDQQQQQEFAEGLRNVKRAIVEALADIQIQANEANVTHTPNWQLGRDIPVAIEMTVAPPGAPVVVANFSREQIEDSWQRLERPDVRQIVRSIEGRYRQLREQG